MWLVLQREKDAVDNQDFKRWFSVVEIFKVQRN